MSKVVIVGSYVVDLMSKAPHLPKPGETVLGGPFHMGPGGKGGNQATAAARCGSEVTFVTKVGDDLFGRNAIQHFKKEKVNTEFMNVDPNQATGAALISVDAKGENSIVVALGACGTITEQEVSAAEGKIKEADIVLLQLETSIEAVVTSVKLANQHQVPVILNPAPYQEFPQEILKGVSIITPNETEACELSGIEVTSQDTVLEAAEQIHNMGVKTVIITLGKKGAFLYEGGETGEIIPAYKVESVDTTGAGDAFNGGLTYAISNGFQIIEAIKFANAVAALSVTKIGTSPAMPYKHEIADFIAAAIHSGKG